MEELLNHSLIIVDKPKGPTSHEISAKIRDLLGVKKATHTGTLDPNVTGVLIILLGESVKLQRLFSKEDKEYVCLMHLHQDIPSDEIKKAVKSFEGVIEQIPPVKSAVARRKRKRKIHKIDILEIKGRYILFKAKVEAGTYMRTLCVQIGRKLNTNANMKELRRISSGDFDEIKALSPIEIYDEFKLGNLKKHLIPIEKALKNKIKITIYNKYEQKIRNGSPLYKKYIKEHKNLNKNKLILVKNEDEKIIGLFKTTNTIENAKEFNIIAKIERLINY